MDRRDFLSIGTLGICSVAGCVGPWQAEQDSDLWQIGDIAIRTAIPDEETVTVKIRDDDTLVYEQTLTLPAVEDEWHYRDVPISGYPTDLGLYTVTCIFSSGEDEYRATFTPDQTADNQDCYNLYPWATETGGQRSASMMRNLCHEATPTGK